jgi:hypothetical protein
MRPRLHPLSLLTVLTITLASLLGAPNPPLAEARPTPPPECVTRTVIRPKTPGWAFVMNFERVSRTGDPIGCMMLFRTVLFPTDFAPVTCTKVGTPAQISLIAGQARFGGGYVHCPANVKTLLAGFTPPAVISDTQEYPYFTIIGAGIVGEGPTPLNPNYANPIGYYQPNKAGEPDLGLFVNLSANGGALISRFNNNDNVGDFNTPLTLAGGTFYTFTVEHDGEGSTLTTTHYLNNQPLDTFGPRAPVRFWANGGAFWIGGSALGPDRLLGTFDEVIFDPPDGGRPPIVGNSDILEMFVPVVMR